MVFNVFVFRHLGLVAVATCPVPLFLRQNLDDLWLDDFWIVLLDCEVTLENANAIRIALHPTLPLMERSRLQTAHH